MICSAFMLTTRQQGIGQGQSQWLWQATDQGQDFSSVLRNRLFDLLDDRRIDDVHEVFV
jgi:hypothetical protein